MGTIRHAGHRLVCEFCSVEYTAARLDQKYCSKRCNHASYNAKIKLPITSIICKLCGVFYTPLRIPSLFCSRRCGHRYRNKKEGKWVSYRYGISPSRYKDMLEEQFSLCAICKCPERSKILNIDHDHNTGQVRSLLCSLCNMALGSFHDRPELAERAALYLRNWAQLGDSNGVERRD